MHVINESISRENWSEPQFGIIEDERREMVEKLVNAMLANAAIRVLSLSPVAVCSVPEVSEYTGNITGLMHPHFAVSVLYQTWATVDEPAPLDPGAARALQHMLAGPPR